MAGWLNDSALVLISRVTVRSGPYRTLMGG